MARAYHDTVSMGSLAWPDPIRMARPYPVPGKRWVWLRKTRLLASKWGIVASYVYLPVAFSLWYETGAIIWDFRVAGPGV